MTARLRSSFPALAGFVLFACARSHTAALRQPPDASTRSAILPPPPGYDEAESELDTELPSDAQPPSDVELDAFLRPVRDASIPSNPLPATAPFAIQVDEPRFWLTPGESGHIGIRIHRDLDFDREIEIRIVGLPRDLQAPVIQTRHERVWIPIRLSATSRVRPVPCIVEASSEGWRRSVRIVIEIYE